MKSSPFFVLCMFAFDLLQDVFAAHEMLGTTVSKSRGDHGRSTKPAHISHSRTSSPTKSEDTTPTRHTIVPKGSEKVPRSSQTHRSHSATGSPTITDKTRPSHSLAVPTSSGVSTTNLKEPVTPTSNQKSPSLRGSSSYPTSTKSPMSSSHPATAITTSTTTPYFGISPKHVTASKTVTIKNGHTASAQLGWMVVGVGIGGSVVVGGDILHVAGGTEAIIVENSSGQDELSSIDTSTTSTSSSTSSSPSASPTPYNIYPSAGSTPPQQSAVTQELEQIAQPGSVRSITGGRGQLLLWVASLTPDQATKLRGNSVVSPLPGPCVLAPIVTFMY